MDIRPCWILKNMISLALRRRTSKASSVQCVKGSLSINQVHSKQNGVLYRVTFDILHVILLFFTEWDGNLHIMTAWEFINGAHARTFYILDIFS